MKSAASDPTSVAAYKTQQERKSHAQAKFQRLLKARRKAELKSLKVRRIPTKGQAIVRTHGGRSRIQRHLASAQRKDRQDAVVEEPAEGQSLKSAMQGKAFEEGKGGPATTSFKVKDLTVDGQSPRVETLRLLD